MIGTFARSSPRVGITSRMPAVLIAAVASPALAAATDEEMKLIGIAGLSLAVLLLSIPAMGFGFVLGSFLNFSTSLLVVLGLAAAPSAWIVWSRGVHTAVDLAPAQAVLLLILGPLAYLGWRFGQRDAKRHTGSNSVVAGNGN